jgi:hypothetical protein
MATGEGPRRADLPALREALDQHRHDRRDRDGERGFTSELAAQAEWVIAMAWHLEPRRTRAAAPAPSLWRQLIAAEQEARRAA